jgi:putative drug exporter of the RND superfamily
MSDENMSNKPTAPPLIARTIHRFAVLVILAWLAITVIMTIVVPSLEQVAKENSVSLNNNDMPSIKAMKRMGEDFKESNSASVAMIVLEGQERLGDDAHQYYDRLIRQLEDDPKHVQHIRNFWGDRLTASAAESADGKAAYVQLDLAGDPGQTSGNESAEAVRDIVERTPPPPGVKAYVTGPAAGRGSRQERQQDGHHSHGGKHGSDIHYVAAIFPFSCHRNSFTGDGRHRIAGRSGNRRVSRPSPVYWSYYLRH